MVATGESWFNEGTGTAIEDYRAGSCLCLAEALKSAKSGMWAIRSSHSLRSEPCSEQRAEMPPGDYDVYF